MALAKLLITSKLMTLMKLSLIILNMTNMIVIVVNHTILVKKSIVLERFWRPIEEKNMLN